MIAQYTKHSLIFKNPIRTSRGEMYSHEVYYIILQHKNRIGYGEAAPLKGLSIDDRPDFEQKLKECCNYINDGLPIDALQLKEFPALQFAFETAKLGLQYDIAGKLFETDFIKGIPIKINGLVWMSSKDEMLEESLTKAEQGYDCIKFKVGALDFDEECRLLESFRKRYSAFKIELRLDANGAFSTDNALEKLKVLARFDIHSIEQPIKTKQQEWMQELCSKTPIPIALDEELIGIDPTIDGEALLKFINPQYIIIKPTLIGGFANANSWIDHALKHEIGWWATSALESNIGLNAIAQWCSTKAVKLPQGLGTGYLYTNNINAPLFVQSGYLYYNPHATWAMPF